MDDICKPGHVKKALFVAHIGNLVNHFATELAWGQDGVEEVDDLIKRLLTCGDNLGWGRDLLKRAVDHTFTQEEDEGVAKQKRKEHVRERKAYQKYHREHGQDPVRGASELAEEGRDRELYELEMIQEHFGYRKRCCPRSLPEQQY